MREKINILDRLRLFVKGYGVLQTQNYFVIYNRKTGEPIHWKIYNAKPSIENIAKVNFKDYCKPFMTEEEVKSFNEETKQHLKEKLKKVNEEIQKNKDKTVNFPNDDIEYKSEVDNEIK